MKCCIQRVSALFQHLPGFIDGGLPDDTGDDYRLPGRCDLDCLGALDGWVSGWRLAKPFRARSNCCRSDCGTRQELPARNFHERPSSVKKTDKDKPCGSIKAMVERSAQACGKLRTLTY
jgi:hypothetical protein